MNVCSLMKFKLCRLCCVKYTTKLGRRKLSAKFLTKKKLNFIVDEYDGEMLSHNEDRYKLQRQHDIIVTPNSNTDSRKEKRTFSYVK